MPIKAITPKRKMMKLVYLLLCHKNPEQVNLLTKQLCKNGSLVFLHWNKQSYHSCVPKLIKREGLTVLPYEESYPVQWGDFSICEAQLAMCRYAIKENADYVFNLSGQDFPLVSQKEIGDFLTKKNGTDFIDILDDTYRYYKRFTKRNQLFHGKKLQRNTFPSRLLRKAYYLVTGGIKYTFPVFRRKPPLPLYYGSNWWCLSRNCLTQMLSVYDKNPQLKEFFQNSICSDECLFQTLFMESSYRGTHQANLTYINWSEQKSSPKTFTMADKNELLNQTEKCFARKFDLTTDAEIVTLLQEKINQEE